ncbi:SH3-containing GRB2-like protein 3-interacting protein 1 isoform X1 [Carassius carassius]|uniref:SH3-containing GRB2-like protein 3-interacting protein 1 isoform X1 n=1 Tax=Carassius carassius TaxID=217509 RepID=UPI0028693BD8|nr:SH3-containing GRB2-like protein 3-interacting protein 1 isoform X1 [Carassius carassius]XP_059427006.1 SH3-containing GRB2-like protein 3-interacting protein 1 isoform X1 [Carassius carassius]
MMEGLKKRTRKAFGIRKKEKDTDSTGSPDRDGGSQKKTNGAPNGFYGEIDWDRYNTPEVDEEGYSIRPDEEEGAAPKEKSHFFSSSESEEEEDHHKKFKIKIRPLPADANIAAPSVDELKASIGNIALSPSPLRRSPGLAKRNPGEEIARPRRAVPTPAPARAPAPLPEPASNKKSPVPEDATALFGPPLETAFDEQKTSEVVIEEPEVWGAPLPEQLLDSSLARPFPTGTLPPLPPKNVPTSPPPIESPATEPTDGQKEEENSRQISQRPSIADLDNIFGPEDSPKPGQDVGDKWICFNDESHQRPPPLSEGEPAPPLPSSPPPPAEPAPPLLTSPPPSEESNTPLPKSPPPPAEPAPSPPSIELAKDSLPPVLPVPKDTTPSPPTVPLPPVEEAPPPPKPDDLSHSKTDSAPCAPLIETQSDSTNSPPTTVETSERTIPPPLVLNQEDKTSPEETPSKENPSESSGSPKEIGQGSRSTPPPPPPPTYRAVVSSPGPIVPAGMSGSESGSSSPARPSSPLATSSSPPPPPPPPPPPRPPSRPKLPPGKPSAGDVNRPFSPPVHSSSPPPLAPLARAESTSSISSTNSLSAATTPTVGKELSVSVSEDDAFVDKLPSFERRADMPAETDQPSLVWFDRGKFYLTFEGCSRGPSPLTMGAQDTLPVAAAFTETVSAYFKGADPNKCVVKITGEMVLSFPAGITRHFANNPSPAVLTFSITNYSRLEHVLPNPQLLCCDTTQPNPNSKEFWVNMPNLMTHLKKVAEQKPQATYYNVDMLKYQVLPKGLQSTPLNLAVSWRCEPTSTDLRIDYKYNGAAMTTPVALNNVQFLIPVDGGVSKLQAVLPPAAWNAEQQRILWKIPDISQKSENGGVGSLLARFQLTEGPSKAAPVAVQFTSEGSTLSGCDIELVGLGYRFSLVKKRFAAGKYMADN